MSFVSANGWDSKTDTEVFLLFIEEVGEMAKEIRKKLSLKGEKVDHGEMSGEFADVLNYLLELAHRMDIDLEQAYRDKFALNAKRTWPDSNNS